MLHIEEKKATIAQSRAKLLLAMTRLRLQYTHTQMEIHISSFASDC